MRASGLAALAALGATASAGAAGTFDYRKPITLNGVVGGPHASFPVLISVTYPELQTGVAHPQGHDIVFRGEDPGVCGGPSSCTLDHEIELWDGSSGTLAAWVRVPSLTDGAVVFMYYGDPGITSPTEAPRAVWDADYVGVWHLKEGHNAAVNGYRDSSRYANHGHGGRGDPLAAPQPVPDGGIGVGQRFDVGDGTYDLVDAGDDGTLHVSGDEITLQAWVRHDILIDGPRTPPATGQAYGILNQKGYFDGYALILNGSTGYCPGAVVTQPCLVFNTPAVTHSLRTTPSASLGPSQWHHVVGTYDGTSMRVFVDGALEGLLAKAGNLAPSTQDQAMWIGHGDQPDGKSWSAPYEGDLDEVRISKVARSPEWIATEYLNQSAPPAFHAVGPEETGPFSLETSTTNARSIGTAGLLYTAGDASVAAGSRVVTFGGGASLPTTVGRGDALVFPGPPVETLYVSSRDSAIQVTVQSPALTSRAAQPYTVSRAFGSLVDWELAREGDLSGERRREVGIVYESPPPGGVTIDGSTTDPVHSIVLTVAPEFRHQGRGGTGAGIDNGASASPALRILDDHVTVEWLEIKGTSAVAAHGIEVASGLDPDNLVTIRYNLIHDFGGDGIRLADPDAVVDVHGNVIHGTAYGVHLTADPTPDARVNIHSNTIYGCAGPGGPSGVKADVRQTHVRVDLRNNIAHSNANGDFGIVPFFDRGYFCNPACQQIGSGGVLGPLEWLADRSNAFQMAFTNVGTDCLYLGSTTPFRGVSVFMQTPGVPSGADLQWDYWNGAGWASLEGAFNDGSGNFQWTGAIYWPDDPAGWLPSSVSGSPSLYFVRACLAAGGYTAFPSEGQMTRIDVGMSSRNNLASDITAAPHSVLWGGTQALDLVPLGSLAFFDTTPGSEDLHIGLGSAAEDQGVDLVRRFSADIDGALRADPWDIGADEASVSTGPDLSVTKDDGQTTAVPGNPITYAITVTNEGPGLLASAVLHDTLPLEILGPVFTPSVGVYDAGSGVWTGLDLGASQSATLTLQGTVAPWARGTLANLVEVSPPEGVDDPNLANNSASDLDTLAPSADLSLAKADAPDPVEIGSLLTYTLTVTNLGPSEATGVSLDDPLPPELEFVSATPSQGTCGYDVPTRVVTCPLGVVPFPGSAVVTLEVRPMALGMVSNSAGVSGSEPDPVSGNDTATEPTMVTASGTGVAFFTITSTSETNTLEWLNPTTDYLSTEIVVRTDRFPVAPGEVGATTVYNAGTAGARDSYVHDTGAGSNGQTFFYGAFVHRSAAPLLSAGRYCTGRPFDHSGAVKWAFSTGIFSITPPTVGGSGVLAPANDHVLYAMERGPSGGTWPTGWLPVQLGGPVQSRSPIVPITVGATGPVVFLGAQDGSVYVADATAGGPGFPWGPTPIGGTVQAAPAGIFSDFGAGFDYLLVGTRDLGVDNQFFALNPATGATIGPPFDNGGGAGGIGPISGMATVHYPSGWVYFTSFEKQPVGSIDTLWALELQAPSPGVFGYKWSRPLGDIDSSPVLLGDRVLVGSPLGGGTLYSVDRSNGLPGNDRTFVHGDGPVRGFVFPDWRNDDLYFATDTQVWSLHDDGASLTNNFPPTGITLGGGVIPTSAVLFVPGSHYVYVGANDGRLYEIDVMGPAPVIKSVVLGDGLATVGAPSLDLAHGLVHVGTEAGIFYAVQVPLP